MRQEERDASASASASVCALNHRRYRDIAHALPAPQCGCPGFCLRRSRGAEEEQRHLENALGFFSRSVKMSVTSWFLVSSSGTRHRLPKEMIFVGREDCELMLQSRSVDKQHAVINYNSTTDQHLVKDLGSLNGTFVNDLRIPDQTYITLKISDVIRFGYDSHIYILDKSQHKVPEEALKHEKYSSQLQSVKVSEDDRTKPEKNIKTQEAPSFGPTPLYGQPSWWGEEDYGSKGLSCDETHPEMHKDVLSVDPDSGSLSDSQPKTVFGSYHRETSYFEIPTKDFQHLRTSGVELHEIPTKDTYMLPPSPPTPTPPVVQSHASFTIEFDDCTPGKIKIKDHVTKFSTRQRKQQAPPSRTSITAAAAEVMSADSKVADWLVHSDVSMMRRRPTCEDVYSTKSDLAVNIKTLKGHHHEDGTQSDSEDPVLKERSKSHHSIQSEQSEASQPTVLPGGSVHRQSPVPAQQLHQPLQDSPPRVAPASPVAPERPLSQSPPQAPLAPSPPTDTARQRPPEHLTQQAFIIEFFDDNPRKKRSQSFTHNPAHSDSYSALKAKLERRKGSERPASVHGHIPPTQQVTVPLKTQGHGGPQRSSSLKREKTEREVALSTSSSPSSTGFVVRPFGSVGKKSKLAQEFAAEFLKDSSRQDFSPTRDKMSPPPMSAPPVMELPPHARIPSPQEPPALSSVSLSYPLQTPAVSQTCVSPSAGHTAVPVLSSGPHVSSTLSQTGDIEGSQKTVRNEEDDSLSDAGTYTIETEAQDKEVEEARCMIDQVFGVLESPEYSGVNTGVYRPVINGGKDERANLPTDGSTVDPLHGFIPAALSGAPSGPIQVPTAPVDGVEGPKWVSRWASLADSYAEPGSTPPQGESLQDLHFLNRSMGSYSYDNSESESSHGSRTRRLLPQVPPEKLDSVTPSVLICHEPYQGLEPLDKVFVPPLPQDSTHHLSIQDDVDPDSLSDASRSDDGHILEKTKRSQARSGAVSPGLPGPPFKSQEKGSLSTKTTSFYIGTKDLPGKPDHVWSPVQSERIPDPPAKSAPTTVLIRHLSGHEPRRTGIKPNSSAPNLQTQDKDSVPTKDSFVRQESFTRERPCDTVQMKKLPHISSHPSIRDLEQKRENSQDTQCFLHDAEGTLSPLDIKFPSTGSGHSSKKGGSSSHMDDSLSGESDVDTASTVSQVSSKNAAVSSASKKRPPISSLQKKSSSSPSVQEKGRQLTARERLSEKRRNPSSVDAPNKAATVKRFQIRRSAGNRGSLDLSEGQQDSGMHWTETVSSDHETSRSSNRSKKPITPLPRDDNGKTSKTVTQQVLTRSNSLSAPRPTRASMLRRARLGEASDNEGAETDRGSQNSDSIPVPPKASGEGKKLSRLDILAMPRKRTGSFTAPSDNETSSTGRSTQSTRNTEPITSTRKTSVGDIRQATSRGGGASGKQPVTHTRSGGSKYSSSGFRRRQKDSEFSSSSEEDYGAVKRSSHPSTSTHTLRSNHVTATPSKSISLETEEDEDQNEADPYQNWSTHSAEIAKLSQDLAKDLAFLAKEIHDVAGDGDSLSSGVGTTTSPTSLPNTPASTISAREELVQHIPEASLNFQKVPPGSSAVSHLDANMNEPEPGSKQQQQQQRQWNREEVILDNLMLNPVSQLSQSIRENTEQLADKMKVLFQNKSEVWEEIEAKINAENEVPILKTSNKEITSILKELRRVQRQLEVINTIVEPGENLLAVAVGPSSLAAQTQPSSKEKKHVSKTRGGSASSNANDGTKRPARGSNGPHYKA
uniref:centrosomal protein of 170 kDa protein B isoform X1 n=1 Tax=Solea senegalensis TaxID=28829 RepID=UPI001CD8957A|nr:centrosomal protein of 170 kDa protein B isoform X1 [Solea senegalensis]